MEDLEKNIVNYSVYILDRYLITYDSQIEVEKFYCEQYYGIIFHTEDGTYQVLHNVDYGDRILINKSDGSWNDIPFKPATFRFLPPGVEAKEIG